MWIGEDGLFIAGYRLLGQRVTHRIPHSQTYLAIRCEVAESKGQARKGTVASLILSGRLPESHPIGLRFRLAS